MLWSAHSCELYICLQRFPYFIIIFGMVTLNNKGTWKGKEMDTSFVWVVISGIAIVIILNGSLWQPINHLKSIQIK